MAETKENEVMEFTEDEMYIVVVQTRLYGLEEAIHKAFEDAKTEYLMGTNGLPFLRLYAGEDEIDLSYYPTDGIDGNSFILYLRSTVILPDEKDDGNLVSCEAFNMGSPFGFALYDPLEGGIELRAQIPEYGGLSDEEQYAHILDLFLYSMGELRDSFSEE